MKWILLVILLGCLISGCGKSSPVSSSGSVPTIVHYVSTGGNDGNPGTLSAPWKTLQKALNSAEAGSTVYLRTGTYNEKVTANVSGTVDIGAYEKN